MPARTINGYSVPYNSLATASGRMGEIEMNHLKVIHGSIQCTDLLGYNLSDRQQLQTVWEKELFMRLCPILVRDAAQILVEMIGTTAPK